MVLVGVLAFVARCRRDPGAGDHTTRTTADEPQYLLTAISLAEDRDLDIADELADGRWRSFHALALPEQTERLADGRRLSPHDPLLPLLLRRAGGGRRLGRGQAGHGGHGRAAGRPAGVDGRAPPSACRWARRPWPRCCWPARRRWPSTAARSTRLPAALAVLAAAAALTSAAPGRVRRPW